jgi:hypothetical protein
MDAFIVKNVIGDFFGSFNRLLFFNFWFKIIFFTAINTNEIGCKKTMLLLNQSIFPESESLLVLESKKM